MGNRMSSLDLAQWCGLAASLDNASGRAAVKGSAFHACAADQADKDDWLMKLTDEERDEIAEWHRPEKFEVTFETDAAAGSECVPLDYADAVKEGTVALNSKGRLCDPSDPDCVSVGHYDFVWVIMLYDGRKVIVVGDIKTSLFTVDGPETLQLTAYGLALADKHGCDGYVGIIWGATEGRYLVSPYVDLMSAEAGEKWRRVKHAALNVSSRPTTGNHCSKCYGWGKCDAYTIIATSNETWEALQEGVEITNDNAAAMLMKADAVEKVAKAAKTRLKLYAAKTPIRNGEGKMWASVTGKGRESVMGVKKIRELLGDAAEQCITRGTEVVSYRWLNDTEAGK